MDKASIEVASDERLGEKNRAAGFGDLGLVGKYRFWRKGVDAALLRGVKAPTGETSQRTPTSEKFEPKQHPGSHERGRGLTHLCAPPNRREPLPIHDPGEGAQALKMGDLFRADVGASYAFRPLGRYPNLSVMLGLHHEWAIRDHSREGDAAVDSGGTTILLNPGLSASLTAWWAMPIPVFQHLGGEHEMLRSELLTGVVWHFPLFPAGACVIDFSELLC